MFATLVKVYSAVRALGFRRVMDSFSYSSRRDSLEKSFPPPPPTAPTEPPLPLTGILSPPSVAEGVLFGSSHGPSLRVSFVSEDVVRFEWLASLQSSADSVSFAIRDQSVLTAQAVVPTVCESLDAAGIKSWALSSATHESVVRADGSIEIWQGHGSIRKLLRRFDPPRFAVDGKWAWAQSISLAGSVYGLGERMSGSPLPRGRYRLWNTDPGGSYGPSAGSPIYVNMPLHVHVDRDGESSLVFFDDPSDATVTVGDVSIETFAEVGPLRAYAIFGSLPRLLERLTWMTGRAPLPPRWSLGFQQSRWGYKSEAEVRAVLGGFVERNLPISAIVLDIDHMPDFRTLEVDHTRFPTLKQWSAELAAKDVHIVAITDPAVMVDPSWDVYKQCLDQGLYVREPGGAPLQGVVWPGVSLFPDFSNPKCRAWWAALQARSEKEGIDGNWIDMNEPVSFASSGDPTLPRCAVHDFGDGAVADHRRGHNVYALGMADATFSGQRAARPEKRPWVISRAGWIGMQRSSWNWTGDVESTWAALRGTIGTVLSYGLCGQGYNGPDIGGFSGHPSPELFIRWFELGAFCPFFRIHCVHFLPPREPWVWGDEVLSIIRRFLELRYSLLPYWYSASWQNSQTGAPLLRPLFWSAPASAVLRNVSDAFTAGDDILVAPVVDEGKTKRTVPLPPGPQWFDFSTGQLVVPSAAGEALLDAPIDRIPLLVRAGTVLPLATGPGKVTLVVYCPVGCAEPRTSTLYSDAGEGYGPSRVDSFVVRTNPGNAGWMVDHLIDDRGFAWPFVSSTVRLIGFGATPTIAVDGKETAFENGLAEIGASFHSMAIRT